MNVRINSTNIGERTILTIAGRLQAADVSELDEEIHAEIESIVFDLSELLSADETAVSRLRELAAEGAEFRGVSPYVKLLMNQW